MDFCFANLCLLEVSLPIWIAGIFGLLALSSPIFALSLLKAKKANEELQKTLNGDKERLAQFEALTNNLAAAVMVHSKDGALIYCNPYTELLTGTPVREIVANNSDYISSLVHEEDRVQYARVQQVISTGEPYQCRFRIWHKTGILMWVECRSVPMFSQSGEIVSTLSIVFDVTASVRSQRQVEERNREIQDFTSMVSHDLKSPLVTIKGMVALINDEMAAKMPAELKEPISHIGRAILKLESLVASILEYARASDAEMRCEKVDLDEIVREVVEDLKPQIQNIQGNIQISCSMPEVIGDTLRLSQVITNVISNSIKYRSNDRALTIDISERASTRSTFFTLAISDNGRGIPPDKSHLIFRPFYRYDSADIEGSGVGLACAKKFIEKFGGEIWVESDGSTETIIFISLKRA